MAKQKNPSKIKSTSHYKKAVLDIMAVCGEMTPKAVRMIRGNDHKRYIAVRDMLEYGWIIKDATKLRIKYDKGSRIEKRSRYRLADVKGGYEDYGKVVNGTWEEFKEAENRLRSGDGGVHKKSLEMSEILTMFYNIGIQINDIPNISKIETNKNYFIDSRQIKKEYREATEKIKAGDEDADLKFNKNIGAISTRDKTYLVYNLGKQKKMVLHDSNESVAHLFVSRERGVEEKQSETTRIFMADNYKHLQEIIFEVWSFKLKIDERRYKIENKSMLDGWHKNSLLFAKSHEGELMLEITLNSEQQDIVKNLTDKYNLEPYSSRITVECEGYRQEGDRTEYHLAWFVPNANRLKTFLEIAALKQENEFYVHAFPEVAEALLSFPLEENIHIVEEDVNEWMLKLLF